MGTEEKKREQGKPILWSQKMVFFFHQPLGHGLIYLILHSFAASATEEGLILQVIPKPLWRGKGVHSNLTQEFPLWLRIQLVSTRSSVRSLAFLTGIRIRRCCELRCRLQMQLGFWDAVLLSCWLFFLWVIAFVSRAPVCSPALVSRAGEISEFYFVRVFRIQNKVGPSVLCPRPLSPFLFSFQTENTGLDFLLWLSG